MPRAALRLSANVREAQTSPRLDGALIQALTHPSLTARAARAHAGRTEVLFSTPQGRFCLHATPGAEDADMQPAWSYGLLYAYDGQPQNSKVEWHIVKGVWITAMFDDAVWTGTGIELGEEAIAASMGYRFHLSPEARPMPPRSNAP